MVELFGNGTTRSYEIENPSPDPDIFTSIFAAAMRVAFALPFVIHWNSKFYSRSAAFVYDIDK